VARLDRLPVNGVKRRAQQRREDGLATPASVAGDEKVMSHAQPAAAGEATHSETSTHFRFPSWRKLLLAAAIRAAPDDCFATHGLPSV